MCAMKRIFIIEDDNTLRDELARLLKLQDFEPAWCTSFTNATEDALEIDASCVILDLKLPHADGLAICRDIRKKSNVPIIMLTSSTNEFDEVMALGLGANDYVTKPYRPAVLLARIQSVLRAAETEPLENSILENSGVALNCDRAEVSFNGKTTELSKNEMRIMRMLMRNAGKIVSRQDIMCELWESDEFVDDNTLTVNVNRLRRALERIGASPDFIKTSRGVGYSIESQR